MHRNLGLYLSSPSKWVGPLWARWMGGEVRSSSVFFPPSLSQARAREQAAVLATSAQTDSGQPLPLFFLPVLYFVKFAKEAQQPAIALSRLLLLVSGVKRRAGEREGEEEMRDF